MSLTVGTVLRGLKDLYPEAKCTLDFEDPLQLLVATILAAQCTDARVNIVTKSLFPKYCTPQDYCNVAQEELEQDIHSCGTFHMKAMAIQQTCATIIKDFNGEVPQNMKDMLTLRGVGRKTAAVVLSTAFGVIEGIPIDTHNIRLLNRMGLVQSKNQHRIEMDMMDMTPHKDWAVLSHLMVAHGRAVCPAFKRNCECCPFKDGCPSSLVHDRLDLSKPVS